MWVNYLAWHLTHTTCGNATTTTFDRTKMEQKEDERDLD